MTKTAWILIVEAILVGVCLTVALDVQAHRKFELLGGVNMWGYRGRVAQPKQPDEVRVVVIGGTRAFGGGAAASATVAASVQYLATIATDHPGSNPPRIVVLNLGRAGALPESYTATLQHYAYLQPDYICIYDDLGIGLQDGGDSAVFAVTAYAPILPLVLREKGMALRFGSVARGYSGDSFNRPVSPPVRRAAGVVLQVLGESASAIDRGLAQGFSRNAGRSISEPGSVEYAEQLLALVQRARERAKGVILVVGPAELMEQRRNFAALTERVSPRLASRPWLRFVNLSDVPELSDQSLRLDGWNYGGAATWAVARKITQAVLDLMRRS